jgi:hypothetical protein
VKELLEEQGKIMRGESMVDAAAIEARMSTKNRAKSREPECIGAGNGTNGVSA